MIAPEVMSPPYRVDLASVRKGSVISQTEVEKLLGVRYLDDPKRYGILHMQVVRWLQLDLDTLPPSDPRHHAKVRGRQLGIAVLTDAEAAEVLPDIFDQSLRRAARTVSRMSYIDRGQLTAAERERLESQQRVMARSLNAALDTERSERAAMRKLDG